VAEPIVFISHSTFKEGMFAGYRDMSREVTPLIERDKPGTVVFLQYASDDDSELHIVHVFPDADAMTRHLEGANERVAKALEFIDVVGYEIYGSPNEDVLERMQGFAKESGATLTVRPHHIGGYLRLAAR
jgi:hypothetical protein